MRLALMASFCLALAGLFVFDQAHGGPEPDMGLVARAAWDASTTLPDSTQVMMTPLVADLDRDGTPEILVTSFRNLQDIDGGEDGVLRVLSGADASEEFVVSDPGCQVCYGESACTQLNARGEGGIFAPAAGLALGDIDGDGTIEIIGLHEGTFEAHASRLIALEADGSFAWCSEALGAPVDPYTHVSLADLDADGSPELVAGSAVFSAQGQLRWDGGRTRTTLSASVADLDGDGTAELITGARAFHGDGSLYWDRVDFGAGPFLPAIVDFDRDGTPEVVSVDHGASRIYLLEGRTGQTRCVVDFLEDGVRQLGGAPALGDVDGDCVPELAVAGKGVLRVWSYDASASSPESCLRPRWSQPIEDITSSQTGATFFDLDGDGSLELIYADEKKLRVYSADHGALLSEIDNSSATAIENPVVVDANGDGQAELVVSANDYGRSGQHGIRVLHDPAARWRKTRSIWNQHAYHGSNVTDDGGIPVREEKSWLDYNHYRSQSGALCGDDDADGVRNGRDNCPTQANPGQENADADPAGDVCDCDDTDEAIYPGAPQLCDGKNNDCDDTAWPALPANERDADGDHALACNDCDDSNASICPGCTQQCDGVNNDCNDAAWPALPADEADNDQDNFMSCAGDCDDAAAAIYPGAPQLCDGKNNDCDDPAWPTLPANEADSDRDGYMSCAGDCDDGAAATYPGAPQLCDGVNNDCNDTAWPTPPADEADGDRDGYRACNGECDDADPKRHPGATESCNGIDDDCDQLTDEDADGEDSDGDGVHNACDNCVFKANSSQEDQDGDGVGEACDNCPKTPNATQKDGDADKVGNACDNCPHRANFGQEDADADGVGDICDNCPGKANSSQHDLDTDGEGDECDLNDAVVLFEKLGHPTLRWQNDPAYGSFNLYRGDLAALRSGGDYSQLPGSNAYANRFCDLTGTTLDDPLRPTAGEALYWLVNGEGSSGESSLGDGAGITRGNAHPCP